VANVLRRVLGSSSQRRLTQIRLIRRRQCRDRLVRLAAHHGLRIGIDAIERRAERVARGVVAGMLVERGFGVSRQLVIGGLVHQQKAAARAEADDEMMIGHLGELEADQAEPADDHAVGAVRKDCG